MASTLDKTLQSAMTQIPECVAAGYVDMTTGMLLAVKTVDSHPQEVLDLVSAATADLFQGSNVSAIEDMFKRSRGIKGNDGTHYFQEIVVFSDNLLHMFLRCKKNGNHVVVIVTRKSANVGMVIAKSRMAVPSLEASL
ncbi:hypothetical protein [Bradyrhizobium sp.]|uniref:hypothetical protein n=1 Tax=Bradyrhizobium sp. TaxID=376 RepID=UPI003C3CC1EB